MVVVLLKLVFSVLSMLSFLLSRLLLTGTAHILVVMIQALRVPGEAAQGALEQLADFIKSIIEYILGFILETISGIIFSAFDAVKEAIMEVPTATTGAVVDLAQQIRSSLEGLLKDVPEIVQGFFEMISTMITDLLNNFNEAVAYLKEKA